MEGLCIRLLVFSCYSVLWFVCMSTQSHEIFDWLFLGSHIITKHWNVCLSSLALLRLFHLYPCDHSVCVCIHLYSCVWYREVFRLFCLLFLLPFASFAFGLCHLQYIYKHTYARKHVYTYYSHTTYQSSLKMVDVCYCCCCFLFIFVFLVFVMPLSSSDVPLCLFLIH